MTDPLTRERQAREGLKETERMARFLAAQRRAALWDLKKELGTWNKVADATGQKLAAITKAAYKRPKEGTTP